MLVSCHRMGCFVSYVLLLSACESDEKKLTRLSQDQAVACLVAQSSQKAFDVTNKQKHHSPDRDSLLREALEDRTKCELATRDLNRFMR